MASLSGVLLRPLSFAAAVTATAVTSAELPDHLPHPCSAAANVASVPPVVTADSLRSLPGVPDLYTSVSNAVAMPVASLTVMQALYQYAKLGVPKDEAAAAAAAAPVLPLPSSSEVAYRWHLPDPRAHGADNGDKCSSAKSKTVVVLLGWLGAKQRHLKRYAEWYTSRGFHAVTFTFPMADVMSYRVGGSAERTVGELAEHIADWATEDDERKLVFHTFSNTGWLTYGTILEKFKKREASAMDRIKGCIVDSAPVAQPDPQVWASGFSAAFLKKSSVATKAAAAASRSSSDMLVIASSGYEPKPAAAEAALLLLLEKFFEVVLNLPAIDKRLRGILELLSSGQPKCPQLYIYSSADRVIPSKSVESFIEQQQKAGHEVRSFDFVSSPHVDHYRSNPALYTSQLTAFLEDCVLTCCKDSAAA